MRWLLLGPWVLLAACDRRTAPVAPPAASAPIEPPSAAVAALAGGSPCPDLPPLAPGLACAQYATARDAFVAAVAGDPAVVAVGEAHAPKGATVPSAAKRFADDLLPALKGRASDLLVELMMPPTGCADAAAEVRKKQAPATTQQAPTNQNEYVALGDRARALGIAPDMLRPSCADMDAVSRAGDGAIEASLAMIARLSAAQASRLIDRDARSDADRGKAVVVYGGMLHNDLDPPADRLAWSYARPLDDKTGGRVVAVDLVVPEFIVDDATWRAFPWVSAYDRAKLGSKTTMFRVGDRTFVIVFPETRG